MKSILGVVFACWVTFQAPSLLAQIPRTISYQGVFTDSLGNAKFDGEYSFTFRFYESGSGGNAIWSETKKLILSKGLFRTHLGDETPFGGDVRFDKPYWLGIQIGTDPEISPRIALTSVGYSISSINSDTAAYARQLAGGTGIIVRSVIGLKDDVILKGAGGTTINTSNDTIVVSGGGGSGSGIQGIQSTNNTLKITNPNGPTATIDLKVPLSVNGNVSNPDYVLTSTAAGTGGGIRGVGDHGFGIVGTATGNSGVNSVGGNSYSPDESRSVLCDRHIFQALPKLSKSIQSLDNYKL